VETGVAYRKDVGRGALEDARRLATYFRGWQDVHEGGEGESPVSGSSKLLCGAPLVAWRTSTTDVADPMLFSGKAAGRGQR
jgi:hypothetical protein